MNLKTPFTNLFGILTKKSIIFESIPDFSDNTFAVYKEFLRRGYNKKYYLLWYISGSDVVMKKNGKEYHWNPKERRTISDKVKNYIYYSNRACIITCNRFIKKEKNELAINLTHGSPLKNVKGFYRTPDYYDYIVSQSEAFIDKTDDSEYQKKKRALGFPRNDVFSKSRVDINNLFGTKELKYIVWYPTYRKHKNGITTGSKNALPILHNIENAIIINEVAKENGVVIVLKPHFAQDVTEIKDQHLSNIKIINDSFYSENNISSYEFLHGCDALLTDYSSVYYDYTLSDRPIGAVWEDIEDFRKLPGFEMDIDFWMKGAEKIYTSMDFCQFIKRIADGEDLLAKERREIRDLANYSTDGKNSQRVVDFIIKVARL